jgi:DNA-binding NarL/FixJ family response regulator
LDAVASVLRRLGIEVVGTATSGDDALALIREHEPDLFVTEIAFGHDDMAGLECVREARAVVRGLKAIVLSVYEDPQFVDAALEAGGTLVSDEAAPRFTVLADPQGNKVCVCTHVGRSD